jgi:transcriptional regulator with XRE-family HTH domain
MEVAELIAKAKKNAGLDSDRALARHMKVSAAIVSAWANDLRAPGAETALKLSALAGVEPLAALATCELARERKPESREFWSKVSSGKDWRKR